MDSNLFVTKSSCESEAQTILWDRIHDLEKEIKKYRGKRGGINE